MTSSNAPLPTSEQTGVIPGPDPGACPTCGGWLKAGMIHRCTICTAEHLGWDAQNQAIPPHDMGPLLRARLAEEAAHPRSESIRRAERGIVRGLAAEGFTQQHQVTHHDRFEIAVDDLLIRVEMVPDSDALSTTRETGDRDAL